MCEVGFSKLQHYCERNKRADTFFYASAIAPCEGGFEPPLRLHTTELGDELSDDENVSLGLRQPSSKGKRAASSTAFLDKYAPVRSAEPDKPTGNK